LLGSPSIPSIPPRRAPKGRRIASALGLVAAGAAIGGTIAAAILYALS
jgi:hypothetical protein